MTTVAIPLTYDDKSYNTDIVSERFLKRRMIYMSGEINDAVAQNVVAQLQYLEEQAPDMDIYLNINSPGGSVYAGLAVVDAMRGCKCDVVTVGTGLVASMGAFILSCGEKGKRFVSPLCEVMIHQPLGGVQGQASDITLVAQHIAKIKKRLNLMLSENTGQSLDRIEIDCDRDCWMDAEETVAYGLADTVGKPDFDYMWR